MKTNGGLDSIFFGGASGFEDDAFSSPSLDDAVHGTGLRIAALRTVAYRQFVGSIVVALLVAIAAVSAAMRPAQGGDQTWKGPMVQEPVLANPNRIAAIKRFELP